ncbi:sensor histidine kinase [Devosia salina]|uniref:histidine kinase n=1 Tax=Devosia salina TaxID=2860336 RepID=A0ABX8WHZ6_9HYPH|nr:sensor histidine kinase [Devosia salina]QYO77641.1 sensor histidine kinase [Devosia salina]
MLSFPAAVGAQDRPAPVTHDLAGHLEALYDPTGALTLDDVAFGEEAKEFAPVAADYNKGFGKPGAAWVRFDLAAGQDLAETGEAFFLVLDPPFLDRLDVYVANAARPVDPTDFKAFEMGAVRGDAARDFALPSFVVPFKPAAEPRSVLIRLENRTTLSLRGSVESTKSLFWLSLSNWLYLGGYFSACLIAAGINFAFWYWLRERYYLLYAGFSLSLGAMAFWRAGLPSLLLPGLAQHVHIPFLGLATGMATFFAYGFAATFVPYRRVAPFAWRLTWAIAATGLLLIALAFFDLWDEFSSQIIVADLTLAVLPLFVVFRLALGGNLSARIYLWSFMPMNIGIAVLLARNFGWLPSNILVDHGLQIGAALHLLTMTVSLGSRINRSERERRKAEQNALLAAQSAEKRANEIAAARTRELEQATVELEGALETERRVSREQMQFIDTVSHEYRTPVAILRANLDVLHFAQANESPVPASPLKRMNEAIQRLVEIVDVSFQRFRVAGEKLAPTLVELDARQLVDDAIKVACGAHQDRTVTVRQHPETENFTLLADAPLLKTALSNLVENALKYSPAVSIVEIDLTSAGEDKLSIKVIDEGIGIPDRDLPFVFDKYYRAANTMTRAGAGLGLHLVRSIVTAHGGDIALASSGGGTIATMTLPLIQRENGAP